MVLHCHGGCACSGCNRMASQKWTFENSFQIYFFKFSDTVSFRRFLWNDKEIVPFNIENYNSHNIIAMLSSLCPKNYCYVVIYNFEVWYPNYNSSHACHFRSMGIHCSWQVTSRNLRLKVVQMTTGMNIMLWPAQLYAFLLYL